MYSENTTVKRPGIPLAFLFCVGAILSTRIIFSRSLPVSIIAVTFFLIVLTVTVFIIWKKGIVCSGFSKVQFLETAPCVIAAAFSMYIAVSSVYAADAQDQKSALLQKTPVSTLTFTAESDATQTEYGWTLKATAQKDGQDLGLVRVSVPENIQACESFRGVGNVKQATDDDYARSLYAQGYLGQVQISKILDKQAPTGMYGVAASIKNKALNTLQPQTSHERSLIAGMCLGYKPALKESGIQEQFSLVGLSHIIAVSGAHLAIVGSALGALLTQLRLSKRVSVVLLCAICALYVLVCGAPVSAQRSWIMSMVGNGSVLFGRRHESLNSLALAGFGLMAFNPTTATDMGFLLSFVSVSALCIFSRYFAHALKRMIDPVNKTIPQLRFITERLEQDGSASLVCATATAPLSSAFFGRLCFIGPLSAVLVGPLIMPLMLCGLLGVLFGCLPWIGPVLSFLPLGASEFCAKGILFLADMISHIPFGSIAFTLTEPLATVALIGGAIALYYFWPHPKRHRLYLGLVGATALVFFVSSILPTFSPARLVVLNIGQGDAILIQDRNRAVLVDTGVDDSVLEALRPFFVTHLDAVVITHQHADHYGGLKAILQTIPTDKVIFGEGVTKALCSQIQAALSEKNPTLQEIKVNDTFQDGGWQFRCLWPQEESAGDTNEDSICFRLTRADSVFSALLTGDAEQGVLAQIQQLPKNISVYKVGHHGSAIAINEAQAKRLAPKVSIASAGKGNKYGHPTRQCRSILESVGSKFICTMDAGTVVTTPQEIGVGVYADVPEALRKK